VSERAGVSLQGRFAALAREGGRGALVTVVDGEELGARLLLEAGGERVGTLGSEALDRAALDTAGELLWGDRSELREVDGRRLFVDVTGPPPRLLIFGAVDLAASLCAVARTVGWRPYVVDPRSRFATPERFPAAEEVVAGWPDEAFARLGGIDRATAVAVLTHDPKLDDAALTVALRSPAFYVGALGSRRTQERRRERLVAQGIGDDELARLAAPIGLDLGGILPPETALAILAEMVALRHGRDGGRLTGARGRIHVPR
jgi:xanthine dehydrogenase accessory factor